MKSDYVILIPARAGSTNISRQNLRLVGNKPLIYYVIKSALKITENVYVSTDSYEIKEISKLYGAKIIDRPKNLTKNSSKLEDIALHSLSQICQSNNYTKCLILNPKYPLIKPTTIKSFFTTLNKKIETIFGYESYPHHQYKKISSGKIPLLTLSLIHI